MMRECRFLRTWLTFGCHDFCLLRDMPMCIPSMRLLTNVIVAGGGATFNDLPHFAAGIVPGDGIFTTWSYRAGVGRARYFR